MNKYYEFKQIAKNLETYKKKIKECERQIEEIYYILSGLKGISTDKIRYAVNKDEQIEKYYKLLEKKQGLVDKIKEYQLLVNWVTKVINRCPQHYRPYIIDIYVNDKSINDVAKKREKWKNEKHFNKKLKQAICATLDHMDLPYDKNKRLKESKAWKAKLDKN